MTKDIQFKKNSIVEKKKRAYKFVDIKLQEKRKIEID